MTILEFTTDVQSQLDTDGDASVDYSSAAYAGPFAARVRRYLNQFCRETFAFYTMRETITLAVNDIQVNLLSTPAVCSAAVFKPINVWVNNTALARVSSQQLDRDTALTIPVTAPLQFAELRAGVIRFNSKCAGTYAGTNYVSGYRDHAALTVDGSLVELPDDILDVAALYCAIPLMRGVVSEEVGINRLKAYSSTAYGAANRFRASNLALHHQL